MRKKLFLLLALGMAGATFAQEAQNVKYLEDGIRANTESIINNKLIQEMVNNQLTAELATKVSTQELDKISKIQESVDRLQSEDIDNVKTDIKNVSGAVEEIKNSVDRVVEFQETVDNKQNDEIEFTKSKVAENSESIKLNKEQQDKINHSTKQEIEYLLENKVDKMTVDKMSLSIDNNVIEIDNNKQDIDNVDKKLDNAIKEQQKVDKKQNHRIDMVEDMNNAQNKMLSTHENRIYKLENVVASNSRRIDRLEKQVDNLGAMSMAMNGIDFGKLEDGDLVVGFGVGSYNNTEAVAVGFGLALTDNLTTNIKFTATTEKYCDKAFSAGATYKLIGGR